MNFNDIQAFQVSKYLFSNSKSQKRLHLKGKYKKRDNTEEVEVDEFILDSEFNRNSIFNNKNHFNNFDNCTKVNEIELIETVKNPFNITKIII